MLSAEHTQEEIEADAEMPTKYGNFRIRAFTDSKTDKEHALLYIGENLDSIPLVRIHSECLTGDAFGSYRCDCGPQLEFAMQAIQERGCGAIVYMRQEGRGIGLFAKMQAYALQEKGFDTLDANLELGHPGDAREYDFAAEMLKSIGFDKIDLLTNNPEKRKQLIENGIRITERVPIIIQSGEHNHHYLQTKATRMGHMLPV